jgi:hypothetical protein
MKKTERKPRNRKPTPYDALAIETERAWAHQNSVVIHRHIRVLRCEAEETEKSIIDLQATLEGMREKRRRIEARLRGLTAVVARAGTARRR